MGPRYMFLCWFVVDNIIELGFWCNLCEKPCVFCIIYKGLFYDFYGVGQK